MSYHASKRTPKVYCSLDTHLPQSTRQYALCQFDQIYVTFKFLSLICDPPLHWRHNDHDGVSNHQTHGCLLNRLFRRRSKKTSKLRVAGLCAGNSPVTGEFPALMASNAENVSIWCRHHVKFMWLSNFYQSYTHRQPTETETLILGHGYNCLPLLTESWAQSLIYIL